MNYYNEIKKELIDNELYKKVKDYSKNKNEIGKKYSVRYLFAKVHPVGAQLSMAHYRLLFSLNDDNEINYYINQIIKRNLSKRQLNEIIKNNEYQRLPENTKKNLMNNENLNVIDFVKNPIVIKNNLNREIISEKLLQRLILEDIPSFLEELGDGFTFIKNEYPIKLGDRYNYIDLLLFNYIYDCFVLIELKVTELKKEYIGQIQVYMNYIDKNVKRIVQNDTIGIIICKQDNEYIIKYCSDDRIISREYKII